MTTIWFHTPDGDVFGVADCEVVPVEGQIIDVTYGISGRPYVVASTRVEAARRVA